MLSKWIFLGIFSLLLQWCPTNWRSFTRFLKWGNLKIRVTGDECIGAEDSNGVVVLYYIIDIIECLTFSLVEKGLHQGLSSILNQANLWLNGCFRCIQLPLVTHARELLKLLKLQDSWQDLILYNLNLLTNLSQNSKF